MPFFPKKISAEEKKEKLAIKEIFILDKDLEHVYPPQYHQKETKPLTALSVSQKIKWEDLNTKKMATIKRIIDEI